MLCYFQGYSKVIPLYMHIYSSDSFLLQVMTKQYGALCGTVGPCCLSLPHLPVCICRWQSPNLSISHPLPHWDPKFVFLHSSSVLYTSSFVSFFLDSTCKRLSYDIGLGVRTSSELFKSTSFMRMRVRTWLGWNPLEIIKRIKSNVERAKCRYYFPIIKILSFAKTFNN